MEMRPSAFYHFMNQQVLAEDREEAVDKVVTCYDLAMSTLEPDNTADDTILRTAIEDTCQLALTALGVLLTPSELSERRDTFIRQQIVDTTNDTGSEGENT
jgi:hypothetical protein